MHLPKKMDMRGHTAWPTWLDSGEARCQASAGSPTSGSPVGLGSRFAAGRLFRQAPQSKKMSNHIVANNTYMQHSSWLVVIFQVKSSIDQHVFFFLTCFVNV